jgi:hypothetical protein
MHPLDFNYYDSIAFLNASKKVACIIPSSPFGNTQRVDRLES